MSAMQPNAEATMFGREFSSAVVMFHEAVGRILGLSAAERKCLDVLDRCGPSRAGTLARQTGLSSGAITGMIDRLEQAGYVVRRPNPTDRRGVLVALRPNTRREQLLTDVFTAFGRDMAEVAGQFSAEQLDAVRQWLIQTTAVLHAHTAELSAREPIVSRRASA